VGFELTNLLLNLLDKLIFDIIFAAAYDKISS